MSITEKWMGKIDTQMHLKPDDGNEWRVRNDDVTNGRVIVQRGNKWEGLQWRSSMAYISDPFTGVSLRLLSSEGYTNVRLLNKDTGTLTTVMPFAKTGGWTKDTVPNGAQDGRRYQVLVFKPDPVTAGRQVCEVVSVGERQYNNERAINFNKQGVLAWADIPKVPT